MPLIKSISGIRGTIGGRPYENLTPPDIVRFTAAFASFINKKNPAKRTVVVGRDARLSGTTVRDIVVGTLTGMGLDVIDVGLATTPTTELAVVSEHAAGGIIITASHNPENWNALKLLNENGEFPNAEEGAEIIKIAEADNFTFSEINSIGKVTTDYSFTKKHIDHVLALKLADVEAIKNAGFTIAFDAVNSVGGIAVPALLEALGVKRIIPLNAEPTGVFAHNPEPLPQHLTDIASIVKSEKADAGFAVDPDVDRLAIITERGEMFGEEYTLVSLADYVLQHTAGNTVSNLSSTRALNDVTARYGGKYTAAAVGEVNVVEKMKATGAVIGGEGNGGVIYPESHYGRDALVGIALFLSQMAKSGKTVSELRAGYPNYFMAKQKIELSKGTDIDAILASIKKHYAAYPINDTDGVKVDFPDRWVHLRKSNTEPIIRIYTEAPTMEDAEALALEVKAVI
ncbi:MAG: phosphoglucosamine mutase [Dysgonamonadaceae bacterium]|nr:phosphoglucosamine mutase [Dysgonamonadaceae bacterium]